MVRRLSKFSLSLHNGAANTMIGPPLAVRHCAWVQRRAASAVCGAASRASFSSPTSPAASAAQNYMREGGRRVFGSFFFWLLANTSPLMTWMGSGGQGKKGIGATIVSHCCGWIFAATDPHNCLTCILLPMDDALGALILGCPTNRTGTEGREPYYWPCCKYIDTLSTLGPHSSPNTPNTMYS